MQPLFFDPTVDPIVTNKTPGQGKDILQESANNLYVGATMKDLEGFKERYAAQLAGREEGRQAGRRGLSGRRPLRQGDPRRSSRHLEAAIPFATPTMKEAMSALVKFYRTGEERRSRRLRRRLGPGQGLAGRHHQRVHRGLHGFARPQRIVGSAGLLREPREDRGDPEDRRQRPVVRGPDALGRSVQEAGRPRHHRQRHRRRDRDRRLRTDHADRHQPAERPEDPREARQQVGVAVERERSLRQVDVGIVPPRVRVDRRRGAARREVEQRGRAS